jgi:hypothetical protein
MTLSDFRRPFEEIRGAIDHEAAAATPGDRPNVSPFTGKITSLSIDEDKPEERAFSTVSEFDHEPSGGGASETTTTKPELAIEGVPPSELTTEESSDVVLPVLRKPTLTDGASTSSAASEDDGGGSSLIVTELPLAEEKFGVRGRTQSPLFKKNSEQSEADAENGESAKAQSAIINDEDIFIGDQAPIQPRSHDKHIGSREGNRTNSHFSLSPPPIPHHLERHGNHRHGEKPMKRSADKRGPRVLVAIVAAIVGAITATAEPAFAQSSRDEDACGICFPRPGYIIPRDFRAGAVDCNACLNYENGNRYRTGRYGTAPSADGDPYSWPEYKGSSNFNSPPRVLSYPYSNDPRSIYRTQRRNAEPSTGWFSRGDSSGWGGSSSALGFGSRQSQKDPVYYNFDYYRGNGR